MSGNRIRGEEGSHLYLNHVDSLVAVSVPFTLSGFGNVDLADLDNDGDLDAVLAGWITQSRRTEAFRNERGAWTDWDLGLIEAEQGGLAIGDYDADGDLDIALTGIDNHWELRADLYRNDASVANQPPSPPGNLMASFVDGRVRFSWTAGGDLETPTPGLGYNLRVGTSPRGNEIMPSNPDPTTRRRLITDRGNVGPNLQWEFNLDQYRAQTVYWSVQTIDHGRAGSTFAPEETLPIPVAAPSRRSSTVLHDAVPSPFNPSTEIRFELETGR